MNEALFEQLDALTFDDVLIEPGSVPYYLRKLIFMQN